MYKRQRYLEERNPAIRCTGYRSSRTLLERLEQGDVDVLVLGGRLEDMDLSLIHI